MTSLVEEGFALVREYRIKDLYIDGNSGTFYIGYLEYNFDDPDKDLKSIYIKEENEIENDGHTLSITSLLYYSDYNGFDRKIVVKYGDENFVGTDGRLFYYYYRKPHIKFNYDTSKGRINSDLYVLLIEYQLQFIQDAYLVLNHFCKKNYIETKTISGIDYSIVDFSLYDDDNSMYGK